MSTVAIQKFREREDSQPFFEPLDRLFDRIRQRAFSVYEERGHRTGRDIEDWLAAEREMLWSPPVELIENGTEFRVRVAAPAFEASEIHVMALPDAIVVAAVSRHKHEKSSGEVCISELGSRALYRRLDLPSPIDVDKTSATLERGVLHLVAAKAVQPKEQKVHAATAGKAA
jgi:HSP20 family molecular chaperone IbpA